MSPPVGTVVVCLRSRLISEAVAELVSGHDAFDALVVDPTDVVGLSAGRDDVIAVLVDSVAAEAVAWGADVPAVVLGRRSTDAGGLQDVAGGLALDVGGGDLIKALEALVAGELTPPSRSGATAHRGRRSDDGLEVLTPREQQVLELIAGAASPTEIASALDVSENTVRTHVQNVLAKLGATSKVDAVARARALGVLDAGRSR